MLTESRHRRQALIAVAMLCLCISTGFAEVKSAATTKPADMKPYTEKILGTDVSFDMVPIPGGHFMLGSPNNEKGRSDDEGPQVKVKIDPFWMGKHEVSWEEYDIWNFDLDILRREKLGAKPQKNDKLSDAVTRPTKPYTDMTFGSGHDRYPAISMTQLAAKVYCEWLSAKTGHYYRLPTEAEWEYAARAGTTTPYSFDPKKMDDYSWHTDNAGDDREVNYQKIGQKKPNPWGLYDMHGNVCEWCLDQYDPKWYALLAKQAKGGVISNPINVPTKEYPRVVRGGAWDFDHGQRENLRSAARFGSSEDWKVQDPQIPVSVWYHTDGTFVGFRVVRPLKVPSAEERKKLKLDPIVPKHARVKPPKH